MRMDRSRSGWGLQLGTFGVAVAMLAVASVGLPPRSAVCAQQEAPRPAGEDSASGIARKQLRLSEEALGLIAKSRDLGAPVAMVWADTIFWSRQVLEARLFLSFPDREGRTQDVEVYLHAAKGAAVADRLAAFADHLARMKALENQYRPLFQQGNLSAFHFARIESARLQAEIWQAREEGRR